MALADRITHMSLEALHPDPKNPRLPADRHDWPDDDELLVFLADQFDPLSIAESIALHGYFPSEPLVVCQEDGRWIVLEGNRRLCALLAMARPDLADRFADADKWRELAPVMPITLETQVPVLEAAERTDADAVVGFRHIGGQLAWKPLQRAQYIAYLVDVRDQDFLHVAETVGEDEAVVRMLYRNQDMLARAEELGRPDLLAQGQARFGTFTAALNRNGLRDWVGARPVGEVRERRPQLVEDRLPDFAELFSWLFGTEREGKVIAETRELTILAEVVRDDTAREELRRTRDLYAAYAMTPGPPKRLLKQFAIAVGNLRAVALSAELIAREERALELADEAERLLEQLRESWADAGTSDGPPDAAA